MKFGTSYITRDTETMIEKACLAEHLDFDMYGVADSPIVGRELYTVLSLIARHTDQIKVGPWVTNPVTRHPAITASAIATVEEIAPERTILGLGAGDSAVFTIGKKPARLANLANSLEFIADLLSNQQSTYDGESVTLHWLEKRNRTPDVPIYLAADGPKTLELAGRIADGVIIGLGVLPEVIETAVTHITRGAKQAGRNPDEIDKWAIVHGNIADSRDRSIDDIKAPLAAAVHHSLQVTTEGKSVPSEYEQPLQRIVENYDSTQHEEAGPTKNRQLVHELDDSIVEYLADRYAITGTASDCIDQINEIVEQQKIDGIWLTTHREERRNVITRFGEEVLPRIIDS